MGNFQPVCDIVLQSACFFVFVFVSLPVCACEQGKVIGVGVHICMYIRLIT